MIYERRIEEQRIEGKPLGRHVKHDPRSRQFPAREASGLSNAWHVLGRQGILPLNQTRGSCTAEALCGARNCKPDYTGMVFAQSDADSLYDAEIVAEGYNPATDDPGGTGLEVCKVARSKGLIASYTHTFDLQSALAALVLRPVITGVNWYEGFDNPDPAGGIRIAGQVRGGHEFVVVGMDVSGKRVACWNSWGPDWGGWDGRFWMPWSVWDRLLGEQGDVTVPVL